MPSYVSRGTREAAPRTTTAALPASTIRNRLMRALRSLAPLGLVLGLVFTSFGAAQSGGDVGHRASALVPTGGSPGADDETALPSRISASLRRAQNALERAEAHVDDRELRKALVSLGAVRANVARAHRAAARQMTAKVDEEAESSPGPDSVIAVLTLEQTVSEGVAGLFDSRTGSVVGALNLTLSTTHAYRDRMLKAVTALDPEGGGADFSDGMADTVDAYSDEVENLTEALRDDRLSPAGRVALERGLARVRATAARVSGAFGGGEE